MYPGFRDGFTYDELSDEYVMHLNKRGHKVTKISFKKEDTPIFNYDLLLTIYWCRTARNSGVGFTFNNGELFCHEGTPEERLETMEKSTGLTPKGLKDILLQSNLTKEMLGEIKSLFNHL